LFSEYLAFVFIVILSDHVLSGIFCHYSECPRTDCRGTF
jgi:hypothetical protein